MKKIFFIGFITFFLGLAVGCGRQEEASISAATGVEYGKAPFFSLANLDGEIVNLEDLISKKIILLNFQSINCPHCSTMIPSLKRLNKEYEKQVKLLSIYVRGGITRLNSLVKSRGIEYTVLFDDTQEVSYQYGIIGVPTLFVIDLEGDIRYVGYDINKAEEIIKELLG